MILVLGGTSDSIEICNLLNKQNLSYFVSVTTAYGEELARRCTDKVLLKKLTIEDMVDFIKENKIDKVIDATIFGSQSTCNSILFTIAFYIFLLN